MLMLLNGTMVIIIIIMSMKGIIVAQPMIQSGTSTGRGVFMFQI